MPVPMPTLVSLTLLRVAPPSEKATVLLTCAVDGVYLKLPLRRGRLTAKATMMINKMMEVAMEITTHFRRLLQRPQQPRLSWSSPSSSARPYL